MKTNTYTCLGLVPKEELDDLIYTNEYFYNKNSKSRKTSNYQLSLPNIGVWSIKQSTFRLEIIDIILNQLSFFVRK